MHNYAVGTYTNELFIYHRFLCTYQLIGQFKKVEKMKAKEQVVMSKNIAHYAFDVRVNNGSISNNNYE